MVWGHRNMGDCIKHGVAALQRFTATGIKDVTAVSICLFIFIYLFYKASYHRACQSPVLCAIPSVFWDLLQTREFQFPKATYCFLSWLGKNTSQSEWVFLYLLLFLESAIPVLVYHLKEILVKPTGKRNQDSSSWRGGWPWKTHHIFNILSGLCRGTSLGPDDADRLHSTSPLCSFSPR